MTRSAVLALAAMLVASSPAVADRPRPTYVMVHPESADGVEARAATALASSNILYLNGCFGPGDCTFSRGFDDSSIANVSSIINGTITISPFDAGDTAWAAVVDCVQRVYKPFNVVVTDEDPTPASHFEAVVAGAPEEAGYDDNTGGVAPFDCQVIDDAVTYSFANVYGGSVPDICWTVAQESAHAFGLDHEFLCPDPMTYLDECGSTKWFRNIDAECGEFEARDCMCGGTRQNAFARILALFGPGTDQLPTVSISEPRDGDAVTRGFRVNASASDDMDIERVELTINGQPLGMIASPPYNFTVPSNLADGVQAIEVRAYDVSGGSAIQSIAVTQGAPCQSADQCPDQDTCVDGRCVLGPGTPGGLGEACTRNEDCSSGLCGEDGDEKHCAEECELGAGGCPDGFGCRKAGEVGVCWPGYDEGGGCRAADGGAGWLAAIALGLTAALGARRRRRRR